MFCFVFYSRVRLETGRNFWTLEFELFVGLREDLGLELEFGSYLRLKQKDEMETIDVGE